MKTRLGRYILRFGMGKIRLGTGGSLAKDGGAVTREVSPYTLVKARQRTVNSVAVQFRVCQTCGYYEAGRSAAPVLQWDFGGLNGAYRPGSFSIPCVLGIKS